MSTSSPVSGCAIKPVITTKQKAVSVNGVVISRAAISRETQNHPASKPIEAWLAAARALVVRELLLQEARRVGIEPVALRDAEGRRETDEEALVRGLVAQEVVTPQADEVACCRYYEMSRQRFRSSDLYEVRHILLAAPPKDVAARANARRRADIIIAALLYDPSVFGEIAKAESACPSGKVGGSLGQIGLGQTVPEFEQALKSMPVGDVATTPVETRYGFHVVWLDRRIAGREMPLDLVRDRIAAWLDERVRRVAIRQYIAILAGRAEITGVLLDASATPLVQ
jgi:peptidyl-prolyl cis-trans isomerase C